MWHVVTPAIMTSIASALSCVDAVTAPDVVGAVTSATFMSMVFAIMATGGLLVTATPAGALRLAPEPASAAHA